MRMPDFDPLAVLKNHHEHIEELIQAHNRVSEHVTQLTHTLNRLSERLDRLETQWIKTRIVGSSATGPAANPGEGINSRVL